MKKQIFTELIPELSQWNNGHGIGVQGWLSAMGTYDLTIAFSNLFWPEFFVYDDCIFREDISKKNYLEWRNSTNGNKTAIESVLNHLHIIDLFPNVDTTVTIDQIVFIGKKLKDMWQAKLNLDFPDRKITVVFDEINHDDIEGYEITFFQERKI
jgi:hypothetical protein